MSSGVTRMKRRRFLQQLLLASGAGMSGVLCPSLLWASGVSVRSVRGSLDGNITRLVFDLSGPVEYSVLTLGNPDRVVVDLRGTRTGEGLGLDPIPGSVLSRMRQAPRGNNDLRVVLDLKSPATPQSFLLTPDGKSGHRLVIDLQHGAVAASTPRRQTGRGKDVIVAIDAGHGGKDPGAIGPAGTFEKDIVLQIARRFERLVQQEPGMQPLMIRTGDYFLPLRERIERARQGRADVFVSIHADAAPNAQAQGSSVFILSERGASSEAARFLARRENAADSPLGEMTNDKDNVLVSVLTELSLTGTIEHSNHLADAVIHELHRVGKVRTTRVERAGFAVLRSPDVPSILVEAAFISNPHEERKLRTAAFQQSLAQALLVGVHNYFSTYAPPDTWLAENRRGGQHVIRRGETLSSIASQYQIPVAQLRRHNNIRGDSIRVGQVLTIPRSGS